MRTGLGLAQRGDRLRDLYAATGRDLLAEWVAVAAPDERLRAGRLTLPAGLTAATAALSLGIDEPHAVVLLTRLARSGYVGPAIVDGETTYTWPAAVRAALRTLLAVEDEARRHAALARWYVERQQPDLALEHALASGEESMARTVLGRSWLPLIVYRHAALARLFRSAPLDWFAGVDTSHTAYAS